MQSVIADLQDRDYSINRLLDHLDDLSEMRGKVDVIVVVKSSVFIALYNNVEATVYAVVEKIHDSLSEFEYDELSSPLRKKLLRYSFGRAAAAFMQDQKRLAEEVVKLRCSSQKFPSLSKFLCRQSLFSGNIDVRKINVIGSSYGMSRLTFEKDDSERMLWVKNKRNKIAHGEQSMSDGGQGIKTSDLRQAFISIGIILRGFISEANALYGTSSQKKSMLEAVVED